MSNKTVHHAVTKFLSMLTATTINRVLREGKIYFKLKQHLCFEKDLLIFEHLLV